MDAIFRALKIENEEDIKIMAKYFIDYIQENNDQQAQAYISSGTGPEQQQDNEETVVQLNFRNKQKFESSICFLFLF